MLSLVVELSLQTGCVDLVCFLS
ncbi:UNVERIFIED_CONTAM: hypothetical protein GTU68_052174 [Idotea baltica]|nr:hypothetical protein [Idotea baltica]